MKKNLFPALLMTCALIMGACSQQEEIKGKATLQVDLGADASFSATRAIDESAYADIQNYTVTLYKTQGMQVVESALYKDWMLDYEVESATQYTLTASYGTESPASYDQLLCSGEETFTVQPGATKTVSFQCKPKAAKVTLDFSNEFDTYYSDCDVTVQTQHMDEPWLLNKSTVGKELFVKANQDENITLTFNVKDKDGKALNATVSTKDVKVNPQTWLKITVKPEVTEIAGGKFGITVTINDQLTEEEVEIVIPNDVFN